MSRADDPRAIAEGLSEAQKRMLHLRAKGNPGAWVQLPTAKVMFRLGLFAEERRASPLTPLGLQVRAILQERQL